MQVVAAALPLVQLLVLVERAVAAREVAADRAALEQRILVAVVAAAHLLHLAEQVVRVL